MRHLTFILLFLCLLSSVSWAQQDRDALYREVFGAAPPAQKIPFNVKVIVDLVYVGDMQIMVNPVTQEIMLPSKQTKHLLSTMLTNAALADLKPYMIEPYIPTYLLEKGRYVFDFSQRNLILNVKTPPNARRKRYISLMRGLPDVPIKPAKVTPWSGYVNLRGSTREASIDDLWDPLVLNTEAVLNRKGWAYRTMGNLDVQGEGNFDFHQVIHDDERNRVRYSMGHVNATPFGFLRDQSIVGIRAEKDEDIFRSKGYESELKYELFLENDSILEVWINKQRRFSKPMLAGFVELDRFPLSVGVNDVDIRVYEGEELVRTYNVTYIHDFVLNTRSDSEFQYALGVNEADGDQFLGEGYYIKRKYHRLAQGPSIQVTDVTSLLGQKTRYASRRGLIDVDYGALFHSGNTTSLGTSLEFSSYPSYFSRRSYVLYNLSLRNFGNDFSSRFSDRGETAWFLSPGFYLNVNRTMSWRFNGVYQERHNEKSSLNYRLTWWASIPKGNYQFMYQTVDGFNGQKTWEITNRFNIYLGRDTVQASHELEDDGSDLTNLVWQGRSMRNPNVRYGANVLYRDASNQEYRSFYQRRHLFSELRMSQSQGLWTYQESLAYNGSRGNIDVELTNLPQNGESAVLTGLRFNTSLAFVGKHWGMGREINNSFVLVYPDETLKPYSFTFNNFDRIDRFGAAVITGIDPYTESSVVLTDTNVPPSVSLESRFFSVRPSSFTGVAFPLRSVEGLIARGRLMESDSEPAAYFSGVLRAKDGDQAYGFFTGKRGTFIVDGIPEGDYVLELPNTGFEGIDVSIQPSKSGVYDVGKVLLRERPYQRR